jgi:hypothetical protein
MSAGVFSTAAVIPFSGERSTSPQHDNGIKINLVDDKKAKVMLSSKPGS